MEEKWKQSDLERWHQLTLLGHDLFNSVKQLSNEYVEIRLYKDYSKLQKEKKF